MRRTITGLLVAALLTIAAALPAAAAKPTRGCPSSFQRQAREAVLTMFPGAAGVFDAVDKNDDQLVCTKRTPGLFNLVDNTSNH